MGRYVVRFARKVYDMEKCDARGYPLETIEYTGEEYETYVEPENSYDVHMLGNGWEEHTVIE